MIKPNELRIGNYVNGELYETGFSVTVRQYKVKSLGEKNAVLQDRKTQSVLSYQDIKPIPLTSEWLLKFGFQIHSDYDFRNFFLPKNNFHISMWMRNDSPGGFEKYGRLYWSDGFIEMHYVHHLQNLYHALTGEELTIQE